MNFDEPVYVEKTTLAVVRSWPQEPRLAEPYSYDRLTLAGLMDFDPGGGQFTDLGERFKAICDGQTFNFWQLPVFLDLLPPEDLANRTPQADSYVRDILQLDWNSRDVRRYINGRMDSEGYTRAIDRPGERDLKTSMGLLEIALDRLTRAFERL